MNRTARWGWYFNRLRCMSVAEVLYRTQTALREGLRARWGGRPRRAPAPDSLRSGQPWWAGSQASLAALQREADEVCTGRLEALGLGRVAMGWPPQWRKDPKTGVQAGLAYGPTMPLHDSAQVGDIKYLWEPSRHHDAVLLAQTWAATRDARYLDALVVLVDSWIAQNPHPRGPHWASSLEAAIRLINWALAWHLVEAGDSGSQLVALHPGFAERWRDAVYWHIRFVREHLSAHSSANNHLIGELAGLFVGLCTWPCWHAMADWADGALASLQGQVQLQTTVDGVHREQATAYHLFVWDFLFIAGHCGKANGRDPGTAYWRRVETMAGFVAALTDSGGHLPTIGDADDGLACGVFLDGVAPWMSLLATAALRFDRGDLACTVRKADPRTVFWCGADAERRLRALRQGAHPPALPQAFAEGGYLVLGKNAYQADEVRAVFDVGPLGYLGIAAHGHADALSLLLSVGGRPVLVDAGTYTYHGPVEWREHFRSTRAHNTLQVGERSSSISGGRFMWLWHAQVEGVSWEFGASLQEAVAEHHGYALASQGGVTHRRRVCFDAANSELLVTDEVRGSGSCDLRLGWQLAPSAEATLQGDRCIIQVDGATVRFQLPAALQWSLVAAQAACPDAWVSSRYERRTAAFQLVGHSVAGRLPTELITRIEIDFAINAPTLHPMSPDPEQALSQSITSL